MHVDTKDGVRRNVSFDCLSSWPWDLPKLNLIILTNSMGQEDYKRINKRLICLFIVPLIRTTASRLFVNIEKASLFLGLWSTKNIKPFGLARNAKILWFWEPDLFLSPSLSISYLIERWLSPDNNFLQRLINISSCWHWGVTKNCVCIGMDQTFLKICSANFKLDVDSAYKYRRIFSGIENVQQMRP